MRACHLTLEPLRGAHSARVAELEETEREFLGAYRLLIRGHIVSWDEHARGATLCTFEGGA